MEEVLFYRGLRNKYDKSKYGKGIYFATDTKEIILNDVSYGSVDIDDELTEIGTNPVIGSAIYKALKDNISTAIDEAPYAVSLDMTSAGNVYTITLRKKDGTPLSTIGPIVGDLSGTTDISGLRVSIVGKQHLQVKSNQQALLSFNYDVWDSNGLSLGTTGKALLFADEALSLLLEEKTISVGDNSFDVSSYLVEGELLNFYVKVTANTNKGEESYSMWYTARLVHLVITSSFDLGTVTKVGDKIEFPCSITGIRGDKYLRAYLNGLLVTTIHETEPTSNAALLVDTTGLSHGTHNVQLRADYTIYDDYGNEVTTVYSNIIYFDVIVVEEGISTPVYSCRFDYEDGDSLISGTPIVNVLQYDLFSLNYYVYDTNASREVEFYSDGVAVGSNTFSDIASSIKYKYTTQGVKVCYFECNNTVYNFIINVVKSSYTISEPTSSLQLYLDALGKSNSSLSRDSWTYKNITTDFENFNWSGNGWTGNSLKLFNGAKATIHHQPFKAAYSGALAFTIRFKVSNAADLDEVIVSCVDPFGNGLTITALEAKLSTQTGEVSTKFASDQTYTIGFVSFPTANDNSSEYGVNNSNMCYIYVDGIISGGIKKDNANEIYQVEPQDIILQAKNCELEVYSIRAYSTELTDDLMLNCHLIDLSDSETLSSEYEQNDLLNLNGEITVGKVTENGVVKIPYFVITGPSEAEGLSQFEFAAQKNDKDPKYPVSSILYVDTNPDYNFLAVPTAAEGESLTDKNSPYIRLQGTSSMGYPRKNYRIYTKSSNLYLGCDKEGNGGILLEKPKYAMSSTAAPVNCFCLKADFAESSSSHNTGTVGLVEEVFAKAGDLTPPQIHVNKEEYPYQVRTTVEGKPCLLFYRSYENEEPIFAGKFNFNNDKSTEDVFGFLDIPGYNDNEEYTTPMDEAATKSLEFPEDFVSVTIEEGTKDEETFDREALIKLLDGNPTECWEFLINSSRMGNFLEADFDKIDPDTEGKVDEDGNSEETLYWLTTWESRFPDEDGLNAAFAAGVKPYYLMHTAKWLVSTNVELATGESLETPVTYGGTTYSYDTALYREAKFRHELSDYFNVNFLCSYYIITECLAAADQRVKNMMWGFWYNPDAVENDVMGKIRCYPIFYDNDTILGLDNTGKIAINWDADENTMNGESYAFAGHDSTLWVNLRKTCSDYLESAYLRLRTSNMTNATILRWYNTNQSDKYAERVYNKDAIWKYVIPANIGVPVEDKGVLKNQTYNFLQLMQGSRRAHRSWFVNNRMDIFDAKYRSGDYQSGAIEWKGAVTLGEGETIGVTAKVSRDYYVSLVEASSYKAHQFLTPEDTFNVNLTSGLIDIGAIFHIYGVKWLKELDLSNWGGYEYITFNTSMPTLEKFIVGGPRGSAPAIAPIEIGNSMPALKYLDITNIAISSINLSGCIYLEELIATGSKLVAVTLAEGCNINRMLLPSTFNNLKLVSLPKLTNDGIVLENPDAIILLRVENCAQVDGLALLNSLLSSDTTSLRYVRITDINVSGDGQDLIRYMNKGLGGLDSNGNTITGSCELIGTYKLTTLLDDSVHKQLCAYFPRLDIVLPEFTTISFDISNSTPNKITNFDNSTGIKFGNNYVPSGHISKILNKRHAYLVKNLGEGTVAAAQLDDNNSNYFVDGTSAALDGTLGDYCMYEPHYWYKGINDHLNKVMYLMFSSNDECPKSYAGLKLTKSDCLSHKGYVVNASSSTNESTLLEATTSLTSTYTAYSYELQDNHPYKQLRVVSVAHSSIGCVVVDKDGNILLRMMADVNAGMHENSYLFKALPENAKRIYFTVGSKNIADYCLYLTESEELDAIEPDWVEHQESFMGRIMSVYYNGDVQSAFLLNANTDNPEFYPFYSTATKVSTVCEELKKKGKYNNKVYYYPADYEALKDVILLAYAKYGRTDLHANVVGAGASQTGEFITWGLSKYKPGNVDYTVYGTADTITLEDAVDYESCYIKDSSTFYPLIATLMGYHQMIGNGSSCSNSDQVNTYTGIYSNTRTNRQFVVNSAFGKNQISKYILGGRYFDLFGANSVTDSSTQGFCGKEAYNTSSSSVSGLVEFGYKASGSTIVAFLWTVTSNLDAQVNITGNLLARLQRILIIPDNINIVDSNTFIGL